MLTQADGRKIALIINEFGDVGVDGDLIKACGSDACGEEDIVDDVKLAAEHLVEEVGVEVIGNSVAASSSGGGGASGAAAGAGGGAAAANP